MGASCKLCSPVEAKNYLCINPRTRVCACSISYIQKRKNDLQNVYFVQTNPIFMDDSFRAILLSKQFKFSKLQ